MIRKTGFGVVLGAALLVPAPLVACTCVVAASVAGEQVFAPTPLLEREAIFAATVLWEDSGEGYDGPGRQRVVSLPEASWRDPAPGPVTLIVGLNAPCAQYQAGGRYLVFATSDGAVLQTERCDIALSLSYPSTLDHLTDLGRPGWIAPPPEESAVEGLTPPSRRPTNMEESLPVDLSGFPAGVQRVELAGDSWVPRGPSGRGRLHLPPGIYAGRAYWRHGWASTFYVGVRCEESAQRCGSLRHLTGLDVRFTLDEGRR